MAAVEAAGSGKRDCIRLTGVAEVAAGDMFGYHTLPPGHKAAPQAIPYQ